MKIGIYSVIGVFGAVFASFFGGWSSGLTTLIIFMAVDYFSGLIVAGIFHNSKILFLEHWKVVLGGKVYAGKYCGKCTNANSASIELCDCCTGTNKKQNLQQENWYVIYFSLTWH